MHGQLPRIVQILVLHVLFNVNEFQRSLSRHSRPDEGNIRWPVTLLQEIKDCTALLKMASGSYYSSPSGREILNSKLETIIADHNKQAEEEAKLVADQKKAIQEMADAMIKRLEQASYQRQVDMHAKMKKMTEKIYEDLQATLEEEEQLKQFSEALIKLSNEIKSAVES